MRFFHRLCAHFIPFSHPVGVRVTCEANNFIDGDRKMILGFIWTLICRYQITPNDGGATTMSKAKSEVRELHVLKGGKGGGGARGVSACMALAVADTAQRKLVVTTITLPTTRLRPHAAAQLGQLNGGHVPRR